MFTVHVCLSAFWYKQITSAFLDLNRIFELIISQQYGEADKIGVRAISFTFESCFDGQYFQQTRIFQSHTESRWYLVYTWEPGSEMQALDGRSMTVTFS